MRISSRAQARLQFYSGSRDSMEAQRIAFKNAAERIRKALLAIEGYWCQCENQWSHTHNMQTLLKNRPFYRQRLRAANELLTSPNSRIKISIHENGPAGGEDPQAYVWPLGDGTIHFNPLGIGQTEVAYHELGRLLGITSYSGTTNNIENWDSAIDGLAGIFDRYHRSEK